MSTTSGTAYLPTFEYLQDESESRLPHPEFRPLVELLAIAHSYPEAEPGALTQRIHAVLAGEAEAGRLSYRPEAHDGQPPP